MHSVRTYICRGRLPMPARAVITDSPHDPQHTLRRGSRQLRCRRAAPQVVLRYSWPALHLRSEHHAEAPARRLRPVCVDPAPELYGAASHARRRDRHARRAGVVGERVRDAGMGEHG